MVRERCFGCCSLCRYAKVAKAVGVNTPKGGGGWITTGDRVLSLVRLLHPVAKLVLFIGSFTEPVFKAGHYICAPRSLYLVPQDPSLKLTLFLGWG